MTAFARINPQRFYEMAIENGEAELKNEITAIIKQIEEMYMREMCVREFIEQAKAYVEMEKLTPEILRTAGNPIIIHFTSQPYRNTDFFTMTFNEEILDALQAQTA